MGFQGSMQRLKDSRRWHSSWVSDLRDVLKEDKLGVLCCLLIKPP